MQEGKLYVAYGSNLSLTQMGRRCPTARAVSLAELEGYELSFRGYPYSAVATIEPKEGGRVPVLLWSIQGTDEMALDRYEGYPHLYGKQQVRLTVGHSTVEAMAYVMNPGHGMAQPSQRYLDIIKEGYRQAGFDMGPLEEAVTRSIYAARVQGREKHEGMDGMGLG